MNRDCADGFCHAEGATGDTRNGVPAGLNYGLIACTLDSGGACQEPDFDPERLSRNASRVFDHARRILGEVEAGTMPPLANADLDDYYRFGSRTTFDLATRTGDTPLPAIDSPEGEEILRNWLACGAPVIGANGTAADIVDAVRSHGDNRARPPHHDPDVDRVLRRYGEALGGTLGSLTLGGLARGGEADEAESSGST